MADSVERRLGEALAMVPDGVLSYVASLVGDVKPVTDARRSKKRKATSEDMCVASSDRALIEQLFVNRQQGRIGARSRPR